MTILILIGFLIVPIIVNLLGVYAMYKSKHNDATLEGLIKYINSDWPVPVLVLPLFSIIVMIWIVIWLISYPIQRIAKRIYEENKYRKI